jgi:hypothetical protein
LCFNCDAMTDPTGTFEASPGVLHVLGALYLDHLI